MSISDVTRLAVEGQLETYAKTGWPALWMGYTRCPEEVEAITGFTYGYVMGDRKSITVIDAPEISGLHLDPGQIVPFMPYASPGHPQYLPPAFHHPFKLLVAADVVASVRFSPKTGAQFKKAAKNDIDGIRHPIVILEMTRWKNPQRDWEIGLIVRPKELQGLLTADSLKIKTKTNALTFGVLGQRAGEMMAGMDGVLEYYGPATPCIIKSADDAVFTVLMAPSAQDVDAAVTKREDPKSEVKVLDEQPRLPGMDTDQKEEESADEGKEGEGSDEEREGA